MTVVLAVHVGLASLLPVTAAASPAPKPATATGAPIMMPIRLRLIARSFRRLPLIWDWCGFMLRGTARPWRLRVQAATREVPAEGCR